MVINTTGFMMDAILVAVPLSTERPTLPPPWTPVSVTPNFYNCSVSEHVIHGGRLWDFFVWFNSEYDTPRGWYKATVVAEHEHGFVDLRIESDGSPIPNAHPRHLDVCRPHETKGILPAMAFSDMYRRRMNKKLIRDASALEEARCRSLNGGIQPVVLETFSIPDEGCILSVYLPMYGTWEQCHVMSSDKLGYMDILVERDNRILACYHYLSPDLRRSVTAPDFPPTPAALCYQRRENLPPRDDGKVIAEDWSQGKALGHLKKLARHRLLTRIADLVSIERLQLQPVLSIVSPGVFLLILLVLAWLKLPQTQNRVAREIMTRFEARGEFDLDWFLTYAWEGVENSYRAVIQGYLSKSCDFLYLSQANGRVRSSSISASLVRGTLISQISSDILMKPFHPQRTTVVPHCTSSDMSSS
uniref:Uncharacterized protein n=1 Tax=Octactis speculum TaxID=3111310 RepID=A0A7S2GS87_9STRA